MVAGTRSEKGGEGPTVSVCEVEVLAVSGYEVEWPESYFQTTSKPSGGMLKSGADMSPNAYGTNLQRSVSLVFFVVWKR